LAFAFFGVQVSPHHLYVLLQVFQLFLRRLLRRRLVVTYRFHNRLDLSRVHDLQLRRVQRNLLNLGDVFAHVRVADFVLRGGTDVGLEAGFRVLLPESAQYVTFSAWEEIFFAFYFEPVSGTRTLCSILNSQLENPNCLSQSQIIRLVVLQTSSAGHLTGAHTLQVLIFVDQFTNTD